MTRKTSEESALFASILASPLASVITDPRRPDNPIRAVNGAFEALTDYTAAEVVGRNCRLLTGPDTDPAASRRLSAAIAERRPELVKLLNYRRDGSTFMNAAMIAPLFDGEGELRYFVGTQMEVAGSKLNDAATRNAAALAALKKLTKRQREILSLMSQGLRNKQIAVELRISEKTVKMHRAAMLDRLQVPTSMEAVRLAVEAELRHAQ
jgi:PAS domain S-box-containing protein